MSTTQLADLIDQLIADLRDEASLDPRGVVEKLLMRAGQAVRADQREAASMLMAQATYVVVDEWPLASSLGNRIAQASRLANG